MIRLIGESACQRNLINSCALENMRNTNYRCNIENCTLVYDQEPRCLGLPRTQDIYVDDGAMRVANKCCGLTNIEFSLIMTGTVVFLVLCLILVWKRKAIMARICKIRYMRIKRRQLMKLRQDSSSSGKRSSTKKSGPSNSLSSMVGNITVPNSAPVDESQRSLESDYAI